MLWPRHTPLADPRVLPGKLAHHFCEHPVALTMQDLDLSTTGGYGAIHMTTQRRQGVLPKLSAQIQTPGMIVGGGILGATFFFWDLQRSVHGKLCGGHPQLLAP